MSSSFRILAILNLVVCLSRHAAYGQVPWVETGFDGTAPIDDKITMVSFNGKGEIAGVVGTGPTIVLTKDRGLNWEFLTAPSASITGIEFFNNRYYLATLSKGLFESTNLKDWTEVNLGRPIKLITSIDSKKGLLLVGLPADSLVYLSQGATNFVALPDSLRWSSPSIARLGKSELLYLTPKGFWRSTIGSSEWTRLSDGLTSIDITVSKDSLYIAKELANKTPWLYASRLDRVDSLSLRAVKIEGSLSFKSLYTTQDSVIIAWRQDKQTGKSEIHYSIDRAELSPPLRSASEYMYDLSIVNGHFYVANPDGIWDNDDYFQNWSKLSARLDANIVQHLLALPDNKLIATTSRGFVMLSTDGGATWEEERYDLRKPATMIGYTPAGTLLVGVPGQLLASRDLGKTFLGSSAGFADRTPLSFGIGKNDKLFLGTDSGLFKSTDDGASWFRLLDSNIFLMSVNRVLPQIYSIAFDRDRDQFFIGTNRGVLMSLNEGEIYEIGWLQNSPIYSITIGRNGMVYAGSTAVFTSDQNKRNFYRARNVTATGETNWYGIDSSFVDEFDLDKIMVNSKGQLIAGVLFGTGDGLHWDVEPINGGAEPRYVEAQAIDENDIAYIAVGIKVYKSAGPKLDIPITMPVEPHDVAIFPNPATDMIQFEGFDEGEVVIYNALGEAVLRSHIVTTRTLDVSQLPAGSYICQIRSARGISRVPLVVVR